MDQEETKWGVVLHTRKKILIDGCVVVANGWRLGSGGVVVGIVKKASPSEAVTGVSVAE